MRLLPDNKTTRQLATLRLRQTTRQLVNEILAAPDNKTTSQRDNEWGGSRLWLRNATPDYKTTSQRDN